MEHRIPIIDAYTHNVPRSYLKEIVDSPDNAVSGPARTTRKRCESQPNLVDFATRISQMDEHGIEKQVSCIYQGVDPNHIPAARSRADLVRLCRMINDDMATEMERSGGRIFCLATPPLSAMEDGGLEEMRRSVQDLGLKGFMVVTNVNGVAADNFRSFWDEANRLGVPVYLHPIDPVNSSSRPYEDEYDLMHVLGWPFETSLILARLVLSGTLSRNADLKVVGHHLGAMVPFFAGRINESYDKEMSLVKPEQRFDEVKGKKVAMEQFKRFYLDTAIGGNAAAIECALEVFGAEKVIFGTDYPFGPGGGVKRLASYPGIVQGAKLSDDERRMIFCENTEKLLGI